MNTTQQASAEESEVWIAWLDGKQDEAVEFSVSVGGTVDISEAGARALKIDVCEELNVRRA